MAAHRLPPSAPGLGPCDLFSEEIHLLVDRELGEAETEVVERHLQGCPRCLGLASHLERMSSVLKAWDQRENDVAPPEMRLRHAVLARVGESSVRRRRDDRFVRGLHFATAAAVVLGLGLAVVLGMRAGGGPSTPDPDPVFAVDASPSPLANRDRPSVDIVSARDVAGPQESSAAGLQAWELLAGVKLPVYEPLAADEDPRRTLVTPEHMKVFAGGDDDSLAQLHLRVERLEAFGSRIGEPVMYWNGPYAGSVDQRVVPERVYRWLKQQNLLRKWRDNSTETSRTSTGPTGIPAGPQATGVLPRDMLRPMQGVTHPLRLSTTKLLTHVPGIVPFKPVPFKPVPFKPGPSGSRATKTKSAKISRRLPPLLKAYPVSDPVGQIPGLLSGPLGQPNRAFLDPIAAWGNHQLRFAESQHEAGTIVAFVTNTKQPIFIPAGQFVTDGHGDRIVRQPTWLPPSKGETAHIIHCFVVQAMPRTTALGVPQLSPHIAGPTIRALLASGASQAEVKAASKAIVRGAKIHMGLAFNEWTWSLRSFYALNAQANAAEYEGVKWKGTHGFLATDAQGRFQGFELVRISGVPAEKLLRRLWLGYVVEAMWRVQSTDLRDAFAAPSDGARRVLTRLRSHPASFRVPVGTESPRGAPRVSTLELEASGVHVHALEVAGRPAIVSGLSSTR